MEEKVEKEMDNKEITYNILYADRFLFSVKEKDIHKELRRCLELFYNLGNDNAYKYGFYIYDLFVKGKTTEYINDFYNRHVNMDYLLEDYIELIKINSKRLLEEAKKHGYSDCDLMSSNSVAPELKQVMKDSDDKIDELINELIKRCDEYYSELKDNGELNE